MAIQLSIENVRDLKKLISFAQQAEKENYEIDHVGNDSLGRKRKSDDEVAAALFGGNMRRYIDFKNLPDQQKVLTTYSIHRFFEYYDDLIRSKIAINSTGFLEIRTIYTELCTILTNRLVKTKKVIAASDPLISKNSLTAHEEDPIKLFENSKWFCYSMLKNGSLGRRTLDFGGSQGNGECPVIIGHFFLKTLRPFVGIAKGSIPDQTLMIEASIPKNDSGEYYFAPSYYLVPLAPYVASPEICIGQIMYLNFHDKRIYSATQVFVPHNQKEPFTSIIISKNDFITDELKSLVNFLSPTETNMIVTPEEMIFTFTQMNDYLAKRPVKRVIQS